MRWCVGAAITLWLAPVFAAGVHVFWPAPVAAVLIGLAAAAAVARITAGPMTETIAPALRDRVVAVIVGAGAIAAIVQIGMLGVYMMDPSKVGFSYQSSDPFRVRHSCMTAYVEAVRFCGQPGTNIYEMSLYEPRQVGPLKVDSYHYPPPFLLLPAVVSAVRADVLGFRSLWFVMQAAILAAAVFGFARWIGGRSGAYAAAGGVLAFATPQFIFSLQQGNVQSTAIPLAAAGLILLCRQRLVAGASLLAYVAAAKIFPGILVVYLIAARRWRAVAATVVCGVAVLALTLLVFGARPFKDFVGYELPRISSGEAFPHTEINAFAVNLSVYGTTVRLRKLGVASLTRPRGLAVASVYGLLVIALAAFAGWRRTDPHQPQDRLRLVQLALALLLLASMRSPFVGFYGFLAAVWLFTLLAAEQPSRLRVIASWIAIAVFVLAHAWIPSPSIAPGTIHFIVADLLVWSAIIACVVTVVRASHAAPAAVIVSGASSRGYGGGRVAAAVR
jgi:alpha-1,2-mannosyltransferase